MLPIGKALRLLNEQGVQATVGPDLLETWELHRQGSPVVFDRRRPGRMLRPVQRMLAAVGPAKPAVILEGLHRTRSAAYSPDPLPPEDLLVAWAKEHPALTVTDGLLSNAGLDPREPLTPADRVVLSTIEDNDGIAPVAEIKSALVASGRSKSRDAAQTLLIAPYLRSAGKGFVRVARGGDVADTPAQPGSDSTT